MLISPVFLSCVLDRQAQLERGDAAAQELVNSLQVLEVMAGAMAAELKPLVRFLMNYCFGDEKKHSLNSIIDSNIIVHRPISLIPYVEC